MAHNEPAIVRDVAKRPTVNEPPLNNTFDSRSSRDLQVLINRSCLTEISRDVDANERINEQTLPIYLSIFCNFGWDEERGRMEYFTITIY